MGAICCGVIGCLPICSGVPIGPAREITDCVVQCFLRHPHPRGNAMTVEEVMELLGSYDGNYEVVVSLFMADGTIVAFPLDGVDEEYGVVHIEVSEDTGIIY